jgi:hypothetical protein
VNFRDPLGVLDESWPNIHAAILLVPRAGWQPVSIYRGVQGRYIPVVSTPRGRHRWLAAVWRLLRWQPATHPQIWSFAVASALAVIAVGCLFSHQHALAGVVAGGGFLTIATGSAGSYRLSRRRDATTYADWLATRPPSRLPGERDDGRERTR